MQVTRGWIGLLLLLSATAQAADLEVTRVENDVSVRQADGNATALAARAPLAPGDTVSTGTQAHISVRLAGGGSLLLGANGALTIDSSEPPDPPGRATLAQLKLLGGTLHVDARKPEQGAPADVRLTVGALQARLYGTEAWAEHSTAGDEICLVSGAAEIDTPGAHQRLDTAGECLRWTAAGAQRLSPAEAGNLLPRLADTNFSDDYATRYAAQQALKEGSSRPTLAQTAAPAPPPAVEPAGVPATRLAAPTQATEWRIALGVFAHRANADRSVAQWRKRSLHADIDIISLHGSPAYRLLCGHYPTRELGEAALARLRAKPGYDDARVLEVPIARSAR